MLWLHRILDQLLPARFEEHDPSRGRILVGSSALISLLAVPYIGLFEFGFGAPLSAGSLLVGSVWLASTPLVLRVGGSRRVATSWLLGVLLLIFVALSAFDGGTGTAMFAFPLVPLTAAITTDLRTALAWASVSGACIAGLFLGQVAGVPYPKELSSADHVVYQPAVAFGLVAAVSGLALLERVLMDRAIAAVAASHAEIHAIVENIADGIASLDRDGWVLHHNGVLARILGPGPPLVGQPLAQRLGLDPSLARGVRAARVIRADGAVAELEVAYEQVPNTEPPRFVATVRDVTTHNEAARAVAARDRALEETRAKSLFLANMSHELRTPLNAIIGYSELLSEVDGPSDDLQRILGAGRHLLALINDLLDLSKIEAGRMELHPEHGDVAALVAGVMETVRPLAVANRDRVEVEVAPDAGAIEGDLVRVRQVLLNLASNAAKFTENGRIGLRVRRETELLVFEIWDEGIGIPADRIEAVFEEFVQADPSTTRRYGGTGLGLAITRHLCRMMGGEILVRSEVGRGSTFTVCLPALSRRPLPRSE